jgi:DNA-binding response OmpR family regulator
VAQIILVEPDRVLADTFRQALEATGHTVTPCASAQAAIFAADQAAPDLVLLELQLIEHSGIEFLYEFRSYEEWQDVPVLILSQVPAGEFASNWRLLREQLGIAEYMYKPQVSLAQLQRAVSRHLNSVPV